jgi:hypothetical protein
MSIGFYDNTNFNHREDDDCNNDDNNDSLEANNSILSLFSYSI